MRRPPTLLLLLAPCAVSGCSLDAAGVTGGVGGVGAAGASSSTSGVGSGAGGAGAGGMPSCMPGATESCYPAPPETRGVGPCKAGERTCSGAGTWGDCAGAVVPTAEVCATTDDESCDGGASCTGDVVVGMSLGDATLFGGSGIDVDAQGRVLLAAGLAGTLSVGGGLTTQGDLDVVLVTLDPQGTVDWAAAYGAGALQTPHAAAFDLEGNLVVVGALSGQLDFGGGPMTNAGGDDTQDGFVAKLDPTGGFLWADSYGDADDQDVFDVAVDASGDLIAVGKMRGTLDMGKGAMTATEEDLFIARLSADGQTKWSKSFGGIGRQAALGAAVAPSGELWLVGDFAQTLDFGGGGVVTTLQPLDVFVARFDANGGHLSSRSFGGGYDDLAWGVAVDADGNAIVVGQVRGPVDFGGGLDGGTGSDADVFVAKYGPTGDFVWAKRFGDIYDQWANGVTVDAAGQVVVTGAFVGTMTVGPFSLASAGGSDVFVLKLDGAGEVVWAKQFGDANPDQIGLAVAAAPTGAVWVYGQFGGELPLGATPGTLAAINEPDPFLIFISP